MQIRNQIFLSLLMSTLIIGCHDNKLDLTKKTNASKIIKKTSSSQTKKENLLNSSTPLKNNVFESVESSSTIENNSSSAQNKINVGLIPTKLSINYVNGSGKHQVAMFLDITQDYSKYIINNISSINDSSIYVFLIGDDDNELIDKIYCSDDQKSNLYLVINNKQISSANRNCNKDGLTYYKQYFSSNFSKDKLPIIVFGDGSFVENADKANTNLINDYNNIMKGN